MPTDKTHTDFRSAIGARLASGLNAATRRRLTLDTTVRKIVLGPGGWRLYGCSTASWYAVRVAADATGVLASSETAPTATDLAAPAAGTAGTGNAWPTTPDTLTPATAPQLPLSTEDFREIAVAKGSYVVLYVRSTSAVNADLEGPFEYLG